MNNCCIVLAAGQGSRFGRKKQFLEIGGIPLWKHVKNKVLSFMDEDDIVVVGVDIEGGITRSQSVINGLRYLLNKKKDYSKVLILEAARPLVTNEQIEAIISLDSDSATYALPVTSTIVLKKGGYIDRNDCLALSTPVVFDFVLFSKAYLTGKYFDQTDDTIVMYLEYGIQPFYLEGSENLLKLTYPSDLLILENLMKKYSL